MIFRRLRLIVLIILSFTLLHPGSILASGEKPYGVFVGINPDHMEKLFSYGEVVIDAAYFSKEEIELLHENNVKVYSYLNVGSLEKFRDYYEEFEDITLDEYENWPEERWVDVSKEKWQSFVVNSLAKDLHEKGVDGFFLDNIDVYGRYPKEEAFSGLLNIMSALKLAYNKKLILNGGFSFLEKAIRKKIELRKIIDGVNRESILTDIDFKSRSFLSRPAPHADFALTEMKRLSRYVPAIYIVEYSSSPNTDERIRRKYAKTRYKVYIARNLALD